MQESQHRHAPDVSKVKMAVQLGNEAEIAMREGRRWQRSKQWCDFSTYLVFIFVANFQSNRTYLNLSECIYEMRLQYSISNPEQSSSFFFLLIGFSSSGNAAKRENEKKRMPWRENNYLIIPSITIVGLSLSFFEDLSKWKWRQMATNSYLFMI